MNTKEDWREDYAEVEVWVHAEYRHKITVKVPENSTAEQEALRILKSEPLDYWCDKESEDWINNPSCVNEDDRFEINGSLTVEEAFGFENTPEDLKEANRAAWNVEDEA